MPFSFIGQPFAGSEQIGAMLASSLRDPQMDRAWILAAWGKRSGLARLVEELKEFRDRGGVAEAVLGVDEGGATIEGLKLAIELFESVWIFHDPGARTFHPKLYAVEGEGGADLLVGSGNLTKGGLYTNYEAAAHGKLSRESPEDLAFLESARGYFDSILALDTCLPLDADLIERLKSDPRILLLSEKQSNAQRKAAGKRKANDGESVFGKSAVSDLRGAPPPVGSTLPNEKSDDDTLFVGGGDAEAGGLGVGAADGKGESPRIASFFKALSANDVSRKDSPGQIIIPRAYLPFFGPLEVQKDEQSKGGPRQAHREFALIYRDKGTETVIPTGRVILYEPAATHKRRNSEVRFTFRNLEIRESLKKDEVLVFERRGDEIVIERRAVGWRPDDLAPSTRYGLI